MKKTNWILLLIICGAFGRLLSQTVYPDAVDGKISLNKKEPQVEQCGFDKMIQTLKKTNPDFEQQIQNINVKIMEQKRENENARRNSGNNSSQAVSPTALYVIPVVVHIVRHPSETLPVISYVQVQSQIDALNTAFANTYSNGNGTYATDTRIQFCLAQTPMGDSWTNALEPGVMRHTDARADNNMQITGTGSTNDLLDLTHPGLTTIGNSPNFPFRNYLNIWVVQSINGLCSGVQGYSILPLGPQVNMNGYLIDGVVIRGDAFGDNTSGSYTLQPHSVYGSSCPSAYAMRDEGKVLVHEVGHYLNLFHTFQDDIVTAATCAGSTSVTCTSEGDFCCDTPPSNINNLSTFPCGGTRNTCSESYQPYLINYSDATSNPNDQVENFMYYSNDACWNTFTIDQTARMVGYLTAFRNDLYTTQNHYETGILGLAGCLPPVLFDGITSSNAMCVPGNNSTTFENPTGAFNTATSWSWSFPGGSPSTSTSSSITVTYPVAGTYTATLVVGDGVITYTNSITVVVSPCSLAANGIAQANWYFGEFGAIDFSSGLPVPNNTALANNTIDTDEGCVSVSDPVNGSVLFYTDGSTVWDNSHAAIISGLPGTTSTSQYIAVPDPTNSTRYYLIIPPVATGGGGLTASLIATTPSVSLVSTFTLTTPVGIDMSEMITAIPNCNNSDYWIIAHGRNTNFYVYRLSANGFTNADFSSALPDAYTFTAGACLGNLKASPNSQRIALSNWGGCGTGTNGLHTYTFDNTTGVVSAEVNRGTSGFYGCSFSPNSDILYASNSFGNLNSYDLVNNTSTTNWGSVSSALGIQLGPNNRIYVASSGSNFLHSFDNPDNYTTPVFSANSVSFVPISTAIIPKLGLPNMIDAIGGAPVPADFTYIVQNDCRTVDFTVDACWQNLTANWNFGDSNTGSGATPSHTYSAAGTYTVTLTLSGTLLSPSIVVTHTISINNTTTTITGSTTTCLGNPNAYTYSVPAVQNATYNWSTSVNGSVITNGGSQSQIQWNSGTTGTVSVTVTNGLCVSTGTLSVTIDPQPTVSILPSSPTVCTGYSVTLIASGASTYSWNTGPTTNTISVSPAINTSYTVTGTSAAGCVNTASVTVTISSPGPCCVSPTVTFTGSSTTSTAAGTFSPGSVVVIPTNHNFIIDNAPTYTNVIFRLQSNARITVLSLTSSSSVNTLTLNNCQLYSDCGWEMWDGIFLEHLGSNYGNITMNNGTSMEDAEYGIVAAGNTATGNNTNISAVINISDCVFNKNHYNVQISNYTNTVTPYSLSINTTTLSCVPSTNSPGSTLLIPHAGERTYAGFRLINVTNCTIGTTTASTDVNYFSDMDYGVYATTSGVQVVNNNFSSMAGNVVALVPTGVGVYAPNTSTNSRIISVGGSATYAPNVFSDLFRAVDATFCGEVEVLNNQMSCTTTPTTFTVSGNITSQFGVRAFNTATKVDIEDNTITNFANAIGMRRNVTTSTTFNPNTIIQTNTITVSGLGYVSNGIVVADANGNSITTTGPVRIRDNSLSDIRDFGVQCHHILNHPVVAGTSAGAQSIGMLFGSASTVSNGVYMLSCRESNISNNEIYSTNNTATGMVGIYLNKSRNSLVSCNDIHDIGIAFRAEGNSQSAYVSATSYQYGVVSNTFTATKGGISLVLSGDIGNQGDVTHPAGNVWASSVGSYTSGQLLTDGTSTTNIYFYDSSQPTQDPSANRVNWGASGIATATGSIPSCPGSSSRMAKGMEGTNSSIYIFPNPGDGHFTISSQSILDFVRIEVYDLMGKKLKVLEVTDFISEQIDLSGFSTGVYYIHLSGNGINETKKVIKE
ncbi:MAG: hypothetical protein K0S33_452 [Bacteroidetes bacterium]|nr:hypothetical protein [Bacteroidota bacterium]